MVSSTLPMQHLHDNPLVFDFLQKNGPSYQNRDDLARAILTKLHENDERYYPMPANPTRALLEDSFDSQWTHQEFTFDRALAEVNQHIPKANTLIRKARIFFQIQCPRSIKKMKPVIVLGIPTVTSVCLVLSYVTFTHVDFLGPKINTHLISRVQPLIGDMTKHCPAALLSLGNHPIVARIYQIATKAAGFFLGFCAGIYLSSLTSPSLREVLQKIHSYRAMKIAVIASVILVTTALYSVLPAVLLLATIYAIKAVALGIVIAGITNALTGLKQNLTKTVQWIENKGLENEKILCEEIKQQLRAHWVNLKLGQKKEQLTPAIVVA